MFNIMQDIVIHVLSTVITLWVASSLNLLPTKCVFIDMRDIEEYENSTYEEEYSDDLTEKQQNFYKSQGVEIPEKNPNIELLASQLAPILNNISDTLEVKSLIHDVVVNMNLEQEVTNKVITHFSEPKIKELQNIINHYSREKSLTDDSILVNTLDELK